MHFCEFQGWYRTKAVADRLQRASPVLHLDRHWQLDESVSLPELAIALHSQMHEDQLTRSSFSQDMELIDMALPMVMVNYSACKLYQAHRE